jgi:hypothetical protein
MRYVGKPDKARIEAGPQGHEVGQARSDSQLESTVCQIITRLCKKGDVPALVFSFEQAE